MVLFSQSCRLLLWEVTPCSKWTESKCAVASIHGVSWTVSFYPSSMYFFSINLQSKFCKPKKNKKSTIWAIAISWRWGPCSSDRTCRTSRTWPTTSTTRTTASRSSPMSPATSLNQTISKLLFRIYNLGDLRFHFYLESNSALATFEGVRLIKSAWNFEDVKTHVWFLKTRFRTGGHVLYDRTF